MAGYGRKKGNGAGVGGPARGGPANGPGWGGPANGPGDNVPGQLIPDAYHKLEVNMQKRERRAHRTEMLEDTLYGLALDAEHEQTRVAAATKLHAIYNGNPVDRVQVDDSPIVSDHIDPNDLSPEARAELRLALARAAQRGEETGERSS